MFICSSVGVCLESTNIEPSHESSDELISESSNSNIESTDNALISLSQVPTLAKSFSVSGLNVKVCDIFLDLMALANLSTLSNNSISSCFIVNICLFSIFVLTSCLSCHIVVTTRFHQLFFRTFLSPSLLY
jgi:hypothetical protein